MFSDLFVATQDKIAKATNKKPEEVKLLDVMITYYLAVYNYVSK